MNTMIKTENPHFRAYDAYYHANMKGTGSVCRLELHPAHEDVSGSIFITLAPQKTVGSFKGGVQVFPTFDWEKRIVMKMERSDLSQIIQVLRGMRESLNDGKGIFHRSVRANTVIKFNHQIEPKAGYLLSASRKTVEGSLLNCWFFFDVDEALTLMLTLEQAMLYICLGIPEVVERTVNISTMQPTALQFGQEIEESQTTSKQDEYRAVSGDLF